MPEQIGSADQYLTLAQAAKVTPGQPSVNAMWRWCRRGVRSRDGARVYLEHIRVGGKIFTTAEWVYEFGQRLATADTAHFRGDTSPGTPLPDAEALEAEAELDRATG